MPKGEAVFAEISYTQLRDRPVPWIAAAASWISVAGRYVLEANLEDASRVRAAVGPLWIALGRDDLLSTDRRSFWEPRLVQLSECRTLGLDIRNALTGAARSVDMGV